MKKNNTTLVRPELVTQEDYIKQRKRCREDFETFSTNRNKENKIYHIHSVEKKQM